VSIKKNKAKMKQSEQFRLQEHYSAQKNWLKWGPYLSERQWGTVREDYSANGTAWDYFPHDHARSRVYRWGEDGIAGISDDMQRICFAIALWNGNDPILKERLYGMTGSEGNHGEDVKELYYYLDNTPSHAYMKHLYKYPQQAFPYADLQEQNRWRDRKQAEYELLDTGIFANNQYWDVFTEYAKGSEEDLLIQITVHNRFSESAELHLLPTLWMRNAWSFGLMEERPEIRSVGKNEVLLQHEKAGQYHFYFQDPALQLFTENENNQERLWGQPNPTPFVKDAFHRGVVQQQFEFLADKTSGTKFSPMYKVQVAGGEKAVFQLRLSKNAIKKPFGKEFDQVFEDRKLEADQFYQQIQASAATKITTDQQNIQHQAYAGMLWSKQYFN
jgi:hypothetical protein